MNFIFELYARQFVETQVSLKQKLSFPDPHETKLFEITALKFIQ